MKKFDDLPDVIPWVCGSVLFGFFLGAWLVGNDATRFANQKAVQSGSATWEYRTKAYGQVTPTGGIVYIGAAK